MDKIPNLLNWFAKMAGHTSTGPGVFERGKQACGTSIGVDKRIMDRQNILSSA
jgi:hypothetical protein